MLFEPAAAQSPSGVVRPRRDVRGEVPARPTVLIDERDRIVDARGDLTPYLRLGGAPARADLFGELRADVKGEVRDLVTRARTAGRAASGLVILWRDGPLACKPVVTPSRLGREGCVEIAFETPLRAMAEALGDVP